MLYYQDIILNKNRYRLYREHKYILHVFNEILRLTSSLDFSIKESIIELKGELKKLDLLLQSHAEHEESKIHSILKIKNSNIFKEAELQHEDHKIYLKKIYNKINLIERMSEIKDIHFLGYEIYLDLRNFFGENLKHFDFEERIIMPELQRLLSDDEIREIDFESYRNMSPEEMIDMLEVLFPHMNSDDKFTFLNDIKTCDPQNFELVLNGIYSIFDENEKNLIFKALLDRA